MKIEAATDLDGAAALALREDRQLSQAQFWGPLGVSQPTASSYERGNRAVPKVTQILTYLVHVNPGALKVIRRKLAKAGRP